VPRIPQRGSGRYAAPVRLDPSFGLDATRT
jgi:hypothetical protein